MYKSVYRSILSSSSSLVLNPRGCPVLKNIKNLNWSIYCNLSKLVNQEQYYVVIRGRNPGLYSTWYAREECECQVIKYPKAQYQKFRRKVDVLKYLQTGILSLKQQESQIDGHTIKILENLLFEHNEKWKELEDFNNLNKSELDTNESSALSQTSNCLIQKPSDNSFTFDENEYLVIYTDGACSNNGNVGAAAGIGVYFGPDNPLNISKVLEGRCTNTRAEIQAVVMALRKAREAGLKKVKIMTDSEFVIRCSTNWLKKWKKNDWKKLNGSPVSNKADLVELDELLLELDVKCVHVRGHQGIEGNEAADQLARSGIKQL